jgi:5'-nucleotidase
VEILITNDDGIDSPGLEVLARAVEPLGRVTVVAPETEQSATSHAITVRVPVRAFRRSGNRIAVRGTPTDCILLSLNGLIPGRPDMVLSGVNHGANMGDDVSYSGTAAAAIEATLFGIPAIAFSVDSRSHPLFEAPARYIRVFAERLIAEPPPPESKTFWNVNFPNVPLAEVRGVRVTTLGKHKYENSVVREPDDGEGETYRVGGGELRWEEDPESDFYAVKRDRFIAITPVHLNMNNYHMIHTMRAWRWNGPSA